MNAAADAMQAFGDIRRGEPMSRHTSWRVGGDADIYFKPASLDELAMFLKSLPVETSVIFVGLGSNLLVRDGGIRGAVVATSGLDREIRRIDEHRVRAGTAVTCARFGRQCLEWTLGPAAFFAGIPGSIGGALAMNAGAFGGETWDSIESVETLDRRGNTHVRHRSDYRIGYRNVVGHEDEWFIAAVFRLEPGLENDPSAIKRLLAKRADTQPIGKASCGSVFRNPPEQAAGKLIETAGLKGERFGGAVVSHKHANFIVNDGTATAADIESLIRRVRDQVEKIHGVVLEPEVRIVGERAAEVQ